MFYGLCFAGFLIATNNLDAIQIPDGDRRFAVLANGGRMTAEMAKKLQTWMEQEGNIAALAQWLETSDLEKFDPFDAPETLTKKAMQEMSRTDRDEAFLTVRKLFGRAALFTGEQFHRAMVAEVPAKTAMREDFGAWASHRLRQTTTSRDGEFRMPLRKSDNKRVLILRWRDYEGPAVKTAEDAQAKVAIIEKILAANTTEERAALLRGLRVIHSEAGDAAE